MEFKLFVVLRACLDLLRGAKNLVIEAKIEAQSRTGRAREGG